MKALWKLSNNRPRSLTSSLSTGVYLKAHYEPPGVGGGSALSKGAPLSILYTVIPQRNFYERFLWLERKKTVEITMTLSASPFYKYRSENG